MVQISYLPVVVTLDPNPPSVLAKPFQMVASGLLDASGHIGHVLEWSKLFNIQPLTVLVVIHDLHELVPIIVPLSAIERGNLAGIKTPIIWIRSLLQLEGMNSMRSSIESSLVIPLRGFLGLLVEDLSLPVLG